MLDADPHNESIPFEVLCLLSFSIAETEELNFHFFHSFVTCASLTTLTFVDPRQSIETLRRQRTQMHLLVVVHLKQWALPDKLAIAGLYVLLSMSVL